MLDKFFFGYSYVNVCMGSYVNTYVMSMKILYTTYVFAYEYEDFIYIHTQTH